MDFKIKIKIEDSWEVFDWKQLNEAILFGNDLSLYPKRFWSGLYDKNKTEIYDGDILSLINEDGISITVICKFGQYKRAMMSSGEMVWISGFSFINDGFPSFPIVHNYMDKCDLDIMEVIGCVDDNSDLLIK